MKMKASSMKSELLFSFIIKMLLLCCMVDMRVLSASDQIMILISYDGFRYDYLDKYKEVLPTLTKLASDGVRAEYLQNVFPTETFPNHYTLVTGLYPESHGIISNNMYDPVFNATFTMKTNDSRWWQAGEPIWVTCEKQKRKAGVCYWPGYDAVIKGYQPTYRPLNTSYGRPFVDNAATLMSWKDNIDMVIGWLNRTNPPSVVILYLNEPDEVGHGFGTDSQEMKNVLKELDGNTTYLMEQLRLLSSFDRINIIFTSDHGMINFNTSSFFSIDQYVDPDTYIMWVHGGTKLLVTNSSESSLEELYQHLKKAEKETGLLDVYKKEEVPEYFHYSHNRRIPGIVVVVKAGHLLNITKGVHYVRNFTRPKNHTYGAHGYGPLVPEMHPYLVAYGPAFKKGYKSGPIDGVDLYPLMCHIIGINPAPNNGSLRRISHILKSSNWFITTLNSHMFIVLGVVCSSVGLFCVAIFAVFLRKHRRKEGHGSVHFTNKRKANFEKPLMGSDDEEDEIVIM